MFLTIQNTLFNKGRVRAVKGDGDSVWLRVDCVGDDNMAFGLSLTNAEAQQLALDIQELQQAELRAARKLLGEMP